MKGGPKRRPMFTASEIILHNGSAARSGDGHHQVCAPSGPWRWNAYRAGVCLEKFDGEVIGEFYEWREVAEVRGIVPTNKFRWWRGGCGGERKEQRT